MWIIKINIVFKTIQELNQKYIWPKNTFHSRFFVFSTKNDRWPGFGSIFLPFEKGCLESFLLTMHAPVCQLLRKLHKYNVNEKGAIFCYWHLLAFQLHLRSTLKDPTVNQNTPKKAASFQQCSVPVKPKLITSLRLVSIKEDINSVLRALVKKSIYLQLD